MERLPWSRLDAVLNALGDLYALSGLDGFPERVLQVVRKLVPSDIITYNVVDTARGSNLWTELPAGAVPDALAPSFLRHMGQHPLIAHYRETGDGRATKISDLVSTRDFHRLDLYNEFFRPLGIERQIAVTAPGAPGVLHGIAFNRTGPDFSEEDRLVLDVMRPHFVRARRNAEAVSLMQRAAGAQGRELVLVGRDGRVRSMAPRAQEWLAAYSGAARAADRRFPDDLARWLRHCQAGLRDGKPAPRAIVPLVLEGSEGTLTARFVPGGPDAEHDVLVLEERPRDHLGNGSRSPAPSGNALAAPSPEPSREPAASLPWLGLSRRETEIVALLAEGRTNAQIARELVVSHRTVQKHLEHIYEKLGVHSRAAAVARALRPEYATAGKRE